MTSKKLLEAQIEVFLEWGRRNSIASVSYKEWLDLFAVSTGKHDILDITEEDIDLFIKKRQDIIRTQYNEQNARKALRAFRKFYMARSKNGREKLREGRPPHTDEINQAKKYRGMGLSFREISKLMSKNVSLVHRWVGYKFKE